MKRNPSLSLGVLMLLTTLTGGCDRLGIGSGPPVADGAPGEQELQKINYMSAADSGPAARKIYTHFEEARSCADFELAMRWNRPPGIKSGPFQKQMVYLTSGMPADLPRNSEVFISGKIERGETLPSGAARWYLRMHDGTQVQAIETADFFEKQEQTSQEGKWVALVDPNLPHRALCGQGVYEGVAGKAPEQDTKIPLVSMLFAMDRRR